MLSTAGSPLSSSVLMLCPLVESPAPGRSVTQVPKHHCNASDLQLTQLQLTNAEIMTCLWVRSCASIRHSAPSAYFPFCEATVMGWAHHFQLECLRLWVAVASAFRALLAELVTLGWVVEQEFVHTAVVGDGVRQLHICVTTHGPRSAERDILWVTMSRLLYATPSRADEAVPIPLSSLSLVCVHALHTAMSTDDVGLLLEAGMASGLGSTPHLPWGLRVFLSYLAACTDASCTASSVRLPKWAHRSAGSRRLVWPLLVMWSPMRRI